MKKHIRWLYDELPMLVKEGVLSEAYAHALRDHYGEVKGQSGRMVALTICSILGALLIGAGIILLMAHNWNDLSRPLRTVLAILPLVAAQSAGAWCIIKGKESAAWRESVSTFIMLMIGSSIALIGQTYHIPGNLTQFLFVWMLLSLPLMYLFRCVIPCLGYLAGIIGWAGSAQYDGGHGLLFWVLYAGSIPHLWLAMRKNRYSISSGVLGWGFCIQALWIGVALERAVPGVWIIIYMGLFATLYLAGAYWFDDAPSGWQKPMQLVGAAGVAVLTLMLTYEWGWHDVGWRSWRYGYRYHQGAVWADFLLAGITPVASLALLVTAVRRGEIWRASFGVAGIVGVVGFAIASTHASETPCMLLCNVYAFVLGIATIVYGIRKGRIGTVNGGMGILSALIVLRFFDEEFSFVVRGCAFIVLGIGFLATNIFLARRSRKEAQA